MPAFKDEHIIIIAPGSQTTLAQLGLPESFTPARLRVKSRMFPAPTPGEFEPSKIRKKPKSAQSPRPEPNGTTTAAPDAQQPQTDEATEEFEEDLLSDEGAVWPIQSGRIVDWPCFFALMQHLYNLLNGPFHTPILLIAQPCWTVKEHERLTQFFFEKFKCPAFALIDAASAACYAFAQSTATVVDIGLNKADVTTVNNFCLDSVGRSAAVPGCGGQSMTDRLLQLLQAQGFTSDMCEQLKRSPICEVLAPGTPLPGSEKLQKTSNQNPASAASTGVNGSGPAPGQSASAVSGVPQGPGPNTAIGEGQRDEEDNEGVLDVAAIVTGGKMNEYLARKDKEKAEKAAAKKRAQDTGGQAKTARLRNSERNRNSFYYEIVKSADAVNGTGSGVQQTAEVAANGNDTAGKPTESQEGSTQPGGDALANSPTTTTRPANAFPSTRREITVGIERFQPHTGAFMTDLGSAIHRTISAFPDVHRRSNLWDNLIVVGNGSRIRGFKEALLANLQARFLISPSSATIFTSELPSTFSTPNPTGANTPQPGMVMQQRGNPLLYAATTASGQHLLAPQSHSMPGRSSGHFYEPLTFSSQSPSSIKLAKLPEYFPEWKDVGPEEAAFLGAQVAAKVIFITDAFGGTQKGYMSRSDYNETGPEGIHGFSL